MTKDNCSPFYSDEEKRNAPDQNSAVNSDDIAFILGEKHTYTWDDFYDTLERERASNNENCPQASYIALELLKSQLIKMPWRSHRTNSETSYDLMQEAYITIADHIKDFDRSQSSFKTYIMKWLRGLAREIGMDGISKYQSNQLGFRVFSSDEMMARSNSSPELYDDSDAVFEVADEQSSVEAILSKKNEKRSNKLFQQMLGNDRDYEHLEPSERKESYVNAAIFHLFLGGISNFPDDVREELENSFSME